MSYDLIDEVREKSTLLDKAITQLGKRGETHAKADRDYHIALAKKLLVLRDAEIPATLCQDICKGDPEIAKLRFERDVAKVTYEAAMEAINGYKLQIRIIDAQIQREWGKNSA